MNLTTPRHKVEIHMAKENQKQSFIIAEIGVNHNGDIKLAKEMIYAAKTSGASAVKFQTFSAESLVTKITPKVQYQHSTTNSTESHYEMIQSLELSHDDHFILKDYCENIGIDFLSTPYDIKSAKFLNDELGVKLFKTASADIVDIPLHQYIANTGIPTMIAVGMASMGEVERALNLYRDCENNDVILLHCVSNYPCSDVSLNMNAMKTLGRAFDCPVGFSDHSIGFLAAVMSIAMGAKVIEKHFTLDKALKGPDHLASATPDEFAELASMVRRAEGMSGSSAKRMQPEEVSMAKTSRKSLVYARLILKGEVIKGGDLVLKRPGSGLKYDFIDYLIGKKAKHDLVANKLAELTDFE